MLPHLCGDSKEVNYFIWKGNYFSYRRYSTETGSKGFVGKNLIAELKNHKYNDIFEYDIDTDPLLLDTYCKEADFVFHLAGVNRPKDQSEFMEGNFGFTSSLIKTLKSHNNTSPIMTVSYTHLTLPTKRIV